LRRLLSAALLSVCTLAGCGDTGRERLTLPLEASGTAPRTVALGDARVTLTRAQVAFGPAYFCASEAGRAELCEVALAELREAVAIDGLDPRPQPLGTLTAVSGEVRSGLFDYGISWLITSTQPSPRPAAPEGHSAILEGTLTLPDRSLRFRVDVDVKASARGDAALNGQRTRHVLEEGTRLALQVDPSAWVDRLDVAALRALDTDADGFVSIPADSTAYQSILQGMLTRAPLRFSWRDE
jgi:hypothetical protein